MRNGPLTILALAQICVRKVSSKSKIEPLAILAEPAGKSVPETGDSVSGQGFQGS